MTQPPSLSDQHNPLLADAWNLLSPKLTPERRDRMARVVQHRTKHLRLVLQDIHDPHNVSACLRSAEAMGVLQVDVINLYQKFTKPSSVARGSAQWLQVDRHQDLPSYVAAMKESGIKIAAGYPSPEAIALEDVPVDQPLAIIFGNEHNGLHQDWLPHLDYRFTIPMVGMVESFNISVSAALAMYHLSKKARACLGEPSYYLTEQEQMQVLNQWILRHSREPLAELTLLQERINRS